MKTQQIVFGIIETMWMLMAVTFAAFGVVALNDMARRNAETSASVSAYVARQQVIADILNDVDRESNSVMIAGTRAADTIARNR